MTFEKDKSDQEKMTNQPQGQKVQGQPQAQGSKNKEGQCHGGGKKPSDKINPNDLRAKNDQDEDFEQDDKNKQKPR